MKQTLIQNVQVWTMDEQDTRFTGWVLLTDGRIADMGEGEPPACADVLDGGRRRAHAGPDRHSLPPCLYEDGLGFEGADGNEDTDPVTPHLARDRRDQSHGSRLLRGAGGGRNRGCG